MRRQPATEADAYELFERLRWGGAPQRCPHCGAESRCYFLRPRSGADRRTRTGAATQRRVWKCAACRRQFSVLTGTVLAGSRVPLRVWAAVLEDWGRDGRPDPGAVVDAYGLTPETARQMVRRVDAVLAGRPHGEASLAVLLGLPADDAARIRTGTPARQRKRRQAGPSAEYGGD